MKLLLTLLLLIASSSSNTIHKIDNFPGAPKDVNVSAYSGYLNATEDPEKQMFFVFFESQSSPFTDPLIIWLQGGPGVSGLYGAFVEIGPLVLDPQEGKLMKNRGSWNKNANLLFLESPVGVGFSVGKPLATDDNAAAEENYRAISNFMNEVRPDFANRTFYIAGQSYAGVYIPYLSRLILQRTSSGDFKNENFRGIMIGNGLFNMQLRTVAEYVRLFMAGYPVKSEFVESAFECMLELERNPTNHSASKHPACDTFALGPYLLDPKLKPDFSQGCFTSQFNTSYENEWKLSTDRRRGLPCYYKHNLHKYFNSEETKRALKVKETRWGYYAYFFSLEFLFDNDATPVYFDVVNLAKARNSAFRILFYSGDQDLLCPISETVRAARYIAHATGLVSYHDRVWQIGKDQADLGGALYVFLTENVILDVLSVRGASHSVPVTHPEHAKAVLNSFLSAEGASIINYHAKNLTYFYD